MAKDRKGHGSNAKGAAYSREVGGKLASDGKSLKSAMRKAGVKPGTKTANAMLAGYHAAKKK